MQRHENDRGCFVEESWINLRDQMVPAHAGPDQIADMRMMYFCGAVSLYDMIAKMLQNKPTSETAAMMNAIHIELETFMAEQVSGNLDS